MTESLSMNKKWLELTDPYPKVEVEQENRYYAKLLLEDYTGAAGELTAVTQYMYHSITSKGEAFGIAELLRKVAITEMHHFEMLGRTIQLLGTMPLLRCMENNNTVFWNAQYIYYGSDVIDKLSANMAREVGAIKSYQLHKKAIEDPYITALLDRIIMDEEHHFRLFKEAKDALSSKSYNPFG